MPDALWEVLRDQNFHVVSSADGVGDLSSSFFGVEPFLLWVTFSAVIDMFFPVAEKCVTMEGLGMHTYITLHCITFTLHNIT